MRKLELGHLAKKILILDDDPNIVRLLRRFLEEKGYTRVISASTVKEGFEKLRQASPDVVLLDFELPDGTGLEVLEEIQRSTPEVGVIMITGYPQAKCYSGVEHSLLTLRMTSQPRCSSMGLRGEKRASNEATNRL